MAVDAQGHVRRRVPATFESSVIRAPWAIRDETAKCLSAWNRNASSGSPALASAAFISRRTASAGCKVPPTGFGNTRSSAPEKSLARRCAISARRTRSNTGTSLSAAVVFVSTIVPKEKNTDENQHTHHDQHHHSAHRRSLMRSCVSWRLTRTGAASTPRRYLRYERAAEGPRQGVAQGLTATLLRRAQELGCHRVVLRSSEMEVGLYRRAGFVERCSLTVYATTRLWSCGEH